MAIFKSVKFYLYSAVAGVAAAFAAHNPMFHDSVIWLLGVLGHAIGVETQKMNGGS